MPSGRLPSWTKEMTERLAQLKRRGCDYPTIAEDITIRFKPISASAASAKAWREGISAQ